MVLMCDNLGDHRDLVKDERTKKNQIELFKNFKSRHLSAISSTFATEPWLMHTQYTQSMYIVHTPLTYDIIFFVRLNESRVKFDFFFWHIFNFEKEIDVLTNGQKINDDAI